MSPRTTTGVTIRVRCAASTRKGLCRRVLVDGPSVAAIFRKLRNLRLWDRQPTIWEQSNPRSRPHVAVVTNGMRPARVRGVDRQTVRCGCGASWVLRSDRLGGAVDAGQVDEKGRLDVLTSELVG